MSAEKERHFVYIGPRTFSRLPAGDIDHQAFAGLETDLQHIVLHSGDWRELSEEEVAALKKKREAEARKAAEEAAKRLAEVAAKKEGE